jgi:hypothetical protein
MTPPALTNYLGFVPFTLKESHLWKFTKVQLLKSVFVLYDDFG